MSGYQPSAYYGQEPKREEPNDSGYMDHDGQLEQERALQRQLEDVELKLRQRSEALAERDRQNEVKFKKEKEEDAIQLPAPEGKREIIGEQRKAHVNGFALDVSNIGKCVYRYELVFTGHSDKNEFVFHTKGGKDDVSIKLRRDALHKLLEFFIRRHGERLVGTDSATAGLCKLAFDYGCSMYLKDEPLKGKYVNENGEDVPAEVLYGEIEKDDIPAAASTFIRGLKGITYTFRHVETVNTYKKNILERPGMQFLEVLTWQKLDRTRHLQFGNKAYYTSTSKPDASIPGGKVVKQGMEKGIRPMGGFMALQVDSKTSPFFARENLVDFIKQFCDPRDVTKNMQAQRQLKNLMVQTIHLEKGKQARFEFKGFSRNSAARETFTTKDGNTTTVQDHFRNTYRRDLRYPDLPLVKQMKGDKISLFPIEMLEIIDGQRVNNSKSDPKMIEALIKSAQKKPPVLEACIHEQKYRAYLDGANNEVMKYFGVAVTDTPMEVTVTELPPPEILYANGRPAQADFKFPEKWRMDKGMTFAVPARSGGKKLYVLVFDRAMRESDARQAVDNLIKIGRERGMDLDNRNVEIHSITSHFDEMERFFASVQKNALAIFGFTQDNTDSVHENLKLLEKDYGVVTQHVCSRILKEVAGGKPMGANNIMMKFNQKLGGINFNLGLSRKIADNKSTPQLAYDSARWFCSTRMYIGLFVSHAGAQSFADRQAGIPQSEPSTVGMAYTTEKGVKLQGTYWMQAPGEQLILNMVEHVATAIDMFAKACRKLPEEIVIYRNGKSEGEFRKLATEIEQIKRACKLVSHECQPTITMIVVMRNSNYRITTMDRNPDNVKPGTVLGKQGCHPNLKEWVAVPHRALMGTARPVRFTVIGEVPGSTGRIMHLDECETVSNSLAYATGIVTGPIAVPAPIDAAEKLAERGRANYKADLSHYDDNMSVASGASLPAEFRNDGSADFFDRLSKKFAPKLHFQAFWA